jgi:L-lactate dehydrogenase complex protein LldG
VLGRIRRAIESPVATREHDYAASRRPYRQAGTLDEGARLALFQSRLEDYGCGCLRCAPDQLPATVGHLLTSRARQRLVVPQGVPSAWLPVGFEWVRDTGLSYGELDEIDGALTGCTSAISQTGSIVLCHEPIEGRRVVTLIPDYHLCVVFAHQVVETVSESLRHPRVETSALITTIAGPSATADIEMTRIRGVHGPRTLDVVLVLSVRPEPLS